MHEREGARVFALVAAALIFCVLVVIWANSSLGTVSYPLVLRWGLPPSMLVYLLYGILGRERMP